MAVIKFDKDGGPITVHLQVEGVVAWEYTYVGDETLPISSKDPPPYVHSRGLPHEVHRDRDTWDIGVANYSDNRRKCRVSITWRQDGKDVHTWKPKQIELAAGESEILIGDAWLWIDDHEGANNA
jgi:hypothetical protein